jgi:hypothetical protein
MAWRGGCGFVLCLAIILGASPATAEQPVPVDPYRQAVLIGVWDYRPEAAPRLGDMSADLAALRVSLESRGFKVEELANPTQAEMLAALDSAASLAEAEGRQRATLTVVYFGGHGTMVQNASYLLAKDFTRPSLAMDLAVSGAIRSDHIGREFSKRGQPVLLLVEACRNPFVEGNPSPVAASGPSALESQPTPMISGPGPAVGFVTFFGQKPGGLVQLPTRTPGDLTPLVKSLVDNLASDVADAVQPLFSEVGKDMRAATAGNPHPLEPVLMDQLSGQLHVYYGDVSRAEDQARWESVKHRRDAVERFLSTYRTSRFTAAARWQLENSPRQDALVAYNRKVLRSLGRDPGFWFSSQMPVAVQTDARIGSGASQVSVEDITLIKSVGAAAQLPAFEVTTADFRTQRVVGPITNADPSVMPDFWKDNSTRGLGCSSEEISGGRCAKVERLADFLGSRLDAEVGTVFIAAVYQRPTSLEPIDTSFDRLMAVENRLRNRGVKETDFALRSFYAADLSPGDRDPILVKRGDGKSLNLE